jgi:hypothetical protein
MQVSLTQRPPQLPMAMHPTPQAKSSHGGGGGGSQTPPMQTLSPPQSASEQHCAPHAHAEPILTQPLLHMKSQLPSDAHVLVPFAGAVQGEHVLESQHPVCGVLPAHTPPQ